MLIVLNEKFSQTTNLIKGYQILLIDDGCVKIKKELIHFHVVARRWTNVVQENMAELWKQ